ncbi:MAG TPA: rRNA maturation RNase YbeY [Sumerlaeia bacterium]|nr:rRNA maturation RNase YbeY [Sumerlaeia bacterium]
MDVLVQCHFRPVECDLRILRSLTRRVVGQVLLDGVGEGARADAEVSVLYVDDAEMRELNEKYRGVSRSTNVLAFPMNEDPGPAIGPALLGDVVVSLETAKRQARETGCSWRHEIAVLLVHGVLHLLGQDHEGPPRNAAKTRAMRSAEARCLRELQSRMIV